jgi:hypothetical protein
MERKGICPNVGLCNYANQKKVQIIQDDDLPFVCQNDECKSELKEYKEGPARKSKKQGGQGEKSVQRYILIAAAAVILGGGATVWFLLPQGKPAVKGLTLSDSQVELTVGETHAFTYAVDPAGAPAEGLVWNSSDEAVARVADGEVEALSAGEAQITLSTPDGKISSRSKVTVNKPETSDPDETRFDLSSALNEGHVVDNGNGTGTISTPYGKYTGDLKDGKAHGNGMFQFFKACRISRRDMQKRVSEEGDYLTGQFEGNEVVSVKWLDRDKQQKGAVLVGSLGL